MAARINFSRSMAFCSACWVVGPVCRRCEQRGGPSHFVNGNRQGHAEDVGRIERLHHAARLVAEQLLLMGQLQQAGDLGAAQRAAALQVGELAGFGRNLLLLAMEVLDGVLQAGLLFHGQLGLDFKTLLAELPGRILEGLLRLLGAAACSLAIPGLAGAAALVHPLGRLAARPWRLPRPSAAPAAG